MKLITPRFGLRLAGVMALLVAGSTAFAGAAYAAPPPPQVTNKTFQSNAAVPIPDAVPFVAGDPGGAGITNSSIFVSGVVGNITKVTVSFYMEHNEISDLDAAVLAPPFFSDNTSYAWFFNALSDTGDNFGTSCAPADQTTFDDAAATNIDAALAPFVGTFQPSASVPEPGHTLAVFNGMTPSDANGEWVFDVIDSVDNGSTGTLHCWSLDITTGSGTYSFTSSDEFTVNDATPGTADTGGPGNASSPIAVSGMNGKLTSVTVSIWIQHTNDSDLDLSLVAPSGLSIALTKAAGGHGDNFGTSCQKGKMTTFDANAMTSLVQGTAPFVGSFRPQGLFSKFNGLAGADLNGIWKLDASDNDPNNVGTIKCWSLTLSSTTKPAPALPDLQVKPGLSYPTWLPGTNNYPYLLVTNNTPDPIDNVTASMTLPNAMSDIFADHAQWPMCDLSGRTLTCNLGTVGAFSTVIGAARVFIGHPGTVCVTATVSATGHGPTSASGCWGSIGYMKGDTGTGYTIGNKAHNFRLQDENGVPVTLAQFAGKYVLLQFSTVWCPPSQFEVPQDRDEVKALNDNNTMGEEVVYLQVLEDGPTPGVPSTLKNARNWVSHFHLTTPVLFTANDTFELAEQQHLAYIIAAGQPQNAVPVSVFIRPDGTVFDVRVGAGGPGDTTARFEADL